MRKKVIKLLKELSVKYKGDIIIGSLPDNKRITIEVPKEKSNECRYLINKAKVRVKTEYNFADNSNSYTGFIIKTRVKKKKYYYY